MPTEISGECDGFVNGVGEEDVIIEHDGKINTELLPGQTDQTVTELGLGGGEDLQLVVDGLDVGLQEGFVEVGPQNQLGCEPLGLGRVVGGLGAQEVVLEPLSQRLQHDLHGVSHIHLIITFVVNLIILLNQYQTFDQLLQLLNTDTLPSIHLHLLGIPQLYERPT